MAKPTSFKIFVVALSTFIITSILSFCIIDVLFAMVLAIIMFIAMIFTIIGFSLGLKFKSDDARLKSFNKIGWIGNLVLFVIIIMLLFIALI